MFGLGMPELIVLLVIVLVVFGAGRLPEIGTAVGRAIRGFKKGLSETEMIDAKSPQPLRETGKEDKK
jgi:sec-independent protein translocase protein TatA